jgi:hypothetical protein
VASRAMAFRQWTIRNSEREPVIRLEVAGVVRFYPLRVMTWHEIVNDMIAGRPVAITYCPLCNASIVFDRRLDDAVLDFGTTGLLRKSDLVMYGAYLFAAIMLE